MGGAHRRSGVNLMEVHISSAGAEQVLFSQAVTVRRPRVLYVAGGNEFSPPLLKTLKLAQVDVENGGGLPVTTGAGDWDAVLLEIIPTTLFSPEEDAALEKIRLCGRRPDFIAGNRNAKLAQERRPPLEKMLPVRGAPPRKKPTAGGARAGQVRQHERAEKLKWLAKPRAPASGTLRSIDKIGVISFDETSTG